MIYNYLMEFLTFFFCQGYRVQEYRTSEYWNDATELVVGGNQHYLQRSQSLEIAIAVKRLAEQV